MRVTPEMVVDAYKKMGLTVCRESWAYADKACGLGALALANGAKIGAITPVVHRLLSDMPKEYEAGFLTGFDQPESIPTVPGSWETGFNDGVAAYKACEEAGLVLKEDLCV